VFFSSRRRHTRSKRDWSSDVCSSDLDSVPVGGSEDENEVFKSWGKPVEDNWRQPHYEWVEGREWIDFERGAKVAGAGLPFYKGRSEERRVGKAVGEEGEARRAREREA